MKRRDKILAIKDEAEMNEKFREWATSIINAKDAAEHKALLNHGFTGPL